MRRSIPDHHPSLPPLLGGCFLRGTPLRPAPVQQPTAALEQDLILDRGRGAKGARQARNIVVTDTRAVGASLSEQRSALTDPQVQKLVDKRHVDVACHVAMPPPELQVDECT